MIRLTEIFYSLQGESSHSGMPCIFIRFAGCNLRCSWCDTEYSHQDGTDYSLEEIMPELAKYPCKLLEITGGEPLCQKEALDSLIKRLLAEGYNLLLETNGSISLADIPPQVCKIVDVKCPDSGEGESFLESNLECLNAKDELKFVIASGRDYIFARDFIRSHHLEGRYIIFSPVSDLFPPSELASLILQDALPVRLQMQLHKQLSIR